MKRKDEMEIFEAMMGFLYPRRCRDFFSRCGRLYVRWKSHLYGNELMCCLHYKFVC